MVGIERGTDKPVYQQIAAILHARIASGEIRPRHPIPSKKAIRQEFDVSDGTVERVYDVLRAEGLIRTVKGLGLFVVPEGEREPPA